MPLGLSIFESSSPLLVEFRFFTFFESLHSSCSLSQVFELSHLRVFFEPLVFFSSSDL